MWGSKFCRHLSHKTQIDYGVLKQEAQVAVTLNHPHILAVYDVAALF
jgi:hypothetical protein